LKRLAIPLLIAALAACNPKESDFFLTEENGPRRGDLTGTVAFGTAPIGGARISLTGTKVDSTTTNGSGAYQFLNLPIGPYTVNASVTDFNCTPSQGEVVEDETATINVACSPQTGSLAGNVSVNLLQRGGVTVSAVQGGNTVASAVTSAGGAYSISPLRVGAYNAVITVPPGVTCPITQQPVTIVSNTTAVVNFACTSPGAIAGQVTVDGSAAAGEGLTVTISQGATVVRTITTGPLGTYSATGLSAGTYSVGLTPPATVLCGSNPRNVVVSGEQTATADFDCTTPVQSFVIQFGSPPFSYLHNGPGDTDACAGFTTVPARPGASYTATWTGPGLVGSSQRTSTLDASGKGVDRQKVNAFGTYTLNLSVTAGGFTAMGSGSIDIVAAQGACPP
jgi:hypothetical protein